MLFGLTVQSWPGNFCLHVKTTKLSKKQASQGLISDNNINVRVATFAKKAFKPAGVQKEPSSKQGAAKANVSGNKCVRGKGKGKGQGNGGAKAKVFRKCEKIQIIRVLF